MDIEQCEKGYAGEKRYARTPGGANLGERILRNGVWWLKHKVGKKYEEVSPEAIAECISGRKVDHIVYIATETEPAVGE
ncbi:MAG: hypothetical protein LUE31_08560 [Lachnospiraceae bacterium]|nr:hypothetical protein [Lachnospiraceae bacterium]